jgi:nucleotide-binding universal stress UspA family protein
MKTILLPLDINSNTIQLFDYAEPIAAEFNACLLLLHIVKKQSYDNGTFSPHTDVHGRVTQESRIILEQLSRKAIIHGIRTKIVIADGNPSEVILDTARKAGADMILVSRTNPSEESISLEILAAAPCPILHWQGSNQPKTKVPVKRVAETFSFEEALTMPHLAAA